MGTSTRNLSTMLDTTYLKPTLSTFSPRKLSETKEAALFLESINNHIWDNNIQEKPTIYALDVKKFLPSVTEELALPAVTAALKKMGIKKRELDAVISGLRVLRKGSFFKWKEDFWQQVKGCPLGDVDSCSYTDLAMSHLLMSMIPATEKELSTDMEWFKIYRDDGLGITFDQPNQVIAIQKSFNSFNNDIQWTLENCSTCNMPEVNCPHYNHLDFLDTRITWDQVKKGDIKLWQFSMSAYSKQTDAHSYLSPTSCTSPHLTEEGVSVAKTVGVRLRAIHSSDQDLLCSLNLYSGYLIARGYKEKSVKFHLASMANRDRSGVLTGKYKSKPKLTIPLVTDLHPAITCLSNTFSSTFSTVCKSDPMLNILVPPTSLLVSYRKLPNLMKLLCSPDQNKFVANPYNKPDFGYMDTGCKCLVCKASKFGKFICSPSMPGYRLPLLSQTSCSSGPAVVYYLVCRSGRPECARAHYVGEASTTRGNQKPMALRWSNYKSHHKQGRNLCQMTDHLLACHTGESAQDMVTITILENCKDQTEAKEMETVWAHKLFSFYPTGLNKREEIQFD